MMAISVDDRVSKVLSNGPSPPG